MSIEDEVAESVRVLVNVLISDMWPVPLWLLREDVFEADDERVGFGDQPRVVHPPTAVSSERR